MSDPYKRLTPLSTSTLVTKQKPDGSTLSLPECRDLDQDTVRLLVRDAEAVTYRAGEAVFAQGDASDCLYMVRTGRLEHMDTGPGQVLQEGDLFGVLEVLSGEERTNSISALHDTELLRVSDTALNELLGDFPEITERLVEVAERHLLRQEMVRLLPGIMSTLDADTLVEMGRVFRWFRLERGEELFAQGDPGDALYVLVSGRLQAQVDTPTGIPRVVGEIVPGETVGEMSLVSDEPRSATVVALRGSVLQVCDRADFDNLVEAHPHLSRHLAAILVQRLKRANQRVGWTRGRMSIALVPLHAGLDPNDFAVPLLEAMRDFGTVLHLDQAGIDDRVGHILSNLEGSLQDLRLLPWFEQQETRHDVVVYEADPTPTPWTMRCVSQADRIVMVADADSDPSPGELEARIEDVLSGARPPIHLVLVHPSERDRPRGTPQWLDPRVTHRHHHVRRGRTADVERAARLLTGRGLGLVLSGGGARGLAHIGVLKALEELGVPVDAIGGTSMGAGMAGQYAMGHSPAEMRDINWRELVERSPYTKYNIPVYSLVGRKVLDASFKAMGAGNDITDLWIPFFCTSCDIQTGEKVIHDRGPLWKAARASTAIPGIVPPVVDGNRLLVDGGILDNIPEEEMQDFCGGRVIAVDVSPGAPVPIHFDYEEQPSPWSVIWHRISPFRQAHSVPTLFQILMRTATVSNASQQDRVDDAVDLVLRPPVSNYGLLEFDAVDRIIEDAATYSREQLQEWLESRDDD